MLRLAQFARPLARGHPQRLWHRAASRSVITTTTTPEGITLRSDGDKRFAEVSMTFAGRRLSLETGRLAGLANAAVFARHGDTTVLVTAVCEHADAPPEDGGTPLQVEYQEKWFATGHIPSTMSRREAGCVHCMPSVMLYRVCGAGAGVLLCSLKFR